MLAHLAERRSIPWTTRVAHDELAQADSRPDARYAAYLAAVIESIWMVLVLASSVPVTLTFCAANFSGIC